MPRLRPRCRSGRYAKGKLGTRGHRARGGKRALLARKAYLRKKRLLAARRAKAGWPAKPSAGLAAGAGGTRRPSPAPANKSQGDPIDDILRNFK